MNFSKNIQNFKKINLIPSINYSYIALIRWKIIVLIESLPI